jgi:cytochrome c oxidase subunit 3
MHTVSPGLARTRKPNFAPIGVCFALYGASVFLFIPLRAYVIERRALIDSVAASGAGVARVQLPVWLWFATLAILVSSLSLWGANRFTRNADPRLARRAIWAAAALGWAFLLLQLPGFWSLLERHRALADQRVFIYGLAALLAALHALHVAAGIVPLTALALRSKERPLGRDRLPTLRYLGWYWHSLALAWFTIFNVIVLVG